MRRAILATLSLWSEEIQGDRKCDWEEGTVVKKKYVGLIVDSEVQ